MERGLMLAALITGTRSLELIEFPDPTPAEGGVVIDVTYCGICGTDVGAYSSGRPYRPSLCGHEWTGVVSALGTGVTDLTEGDRVVVSVPGPCGECAPCLSDSPANCVTVVDFIHGRYAGSPPHGGFAPRIAVPTGRALRAHPDLDDEVLAQVEPVTICVHAVTRAGVREGDKVVVLGAGPVGATALQCAAAAGAAELIVVEPDDSRRALAMRLGGRGAAMVCAATPESAGDVVADHTDGMGADVVLDCVGGSAALAEGVALARRGGTVCMVGLAQGSASIEPAEWLRKEITVTTAIGYQRDDFEVAMGLLASGAVRVSDLHTSTTSLQ
ncbi:MAG: zinc-dependent alcohol dehydrogenase [Microthrixaceae bacterium]